MNQATKTNSHEFEAEQLDRRLRELSNRCRDLARTVVRIQSENDFIRGEFGKFTRRIEALEAMSVLECFAEGKS